MIHIPVLLNEVIKYLNPKSNQNFIDCTIGGGGHSLEILKNTNPNGKILGIDFNINAINNLKTKFKELSLEKRVLLVCDNFANLKNIVKNNNFKNINGIIIDLGLSSDLIETSGLGFSFMRNEILDMRYNPELTNITAQEIINTYSKEELVRIFKKYGQERFSLRIGNNIVKQRKIKKIKTTSDLVYIIKISLGKYYHIKSLARVFQALRIVVNNELENLNQTLLHSIDILKSGNKIVVISYHSLEDRIVKMFFKNQNLINPLFKKPIVPSKAEVQKNKRSRSAKLRIGEKI